MENDISIKQVIDAVAELSLKVDIIGKQHTTFPQLAFEDNDVRRSVSAMRKAENILELTESTQLLEWFYDEATECAVLQCLPCFELSIAAKPTLAKLTPLKAQQLLNPKSNGTLSSGLFVKKESTKLLIKGHNQTWYRQKCLCIDHMCLIGGGSLTHKKAMVEFNKKLRHNERVTTTTGNIFRAAIVDVKLGAAGVQFETLISFLACWVRVSMWGPLGIPNNNFNNILYCLEKAVDNRINTWLNTPLPSTLLPPHFWATVDKAAPSRTTNQAVLIVARENNGIPCPIPVAAPPVYSAFTEATYDDLARQLLEAVSEHFSEEVLSRLCGIAADGPYQATGFAAQFRESLGMELNDELAMPVTWDAAHLLNLAVTDVQDAKTESGSHFRLFVKRCNVFNHILANGKGFAFLQMVNKDARRPGTYATQRFASSSYEQWVKIEKSYESFWKAFDQLHPRRSKEEEWQYMIAGSDFVTDLGFLDIMDTVINLMLRAQALDTPIWKLKLWWPNVKAKLIKASHGHSQAFPRLHKALPNLKPGGLFKVVNLLEGWLIVKDDGADAGENRFKWKAWEEFDVKADRERLAGDLADALDQPVNSVVNDPAISQLAVFDAANLVKLHCGLASEGLAKFFWPDGEIEEYGVQECKSILKIASKMPHIKSSGVNFDPRMAHLYMALIKKAIMQGIWKGICPEWFEVVSDNEVLNKDGADLAELRYEESTELDLHFTMVFSDGKVQKVRLQEQRVYQSFYSKKEIHDIAKPPSCALLDIVLAKGGPEAIAESFYNSMQNQQQSGGQLNETLARRTKVNWCLPSLKHCDEIIEEAVALYLRGDDVIRPHMKNTFSSGRAKEYFVSKVVDRIDADRGRCPFLVKK